METTIQFAKIKNRIIEISKREKNQDILNIEFLAMQWLQYKTDISKMDNLEVLVIQTAHGYVVEFYNSNTSKQYTKFNEKGLNEWFITVPMLQELLSGKNPKKVENKYKKNIAL